ncbi:flagellin, partial [Undibacterium sp.]|uniref:flagellin n=1 Tax=Undibacterium sp. TaxID=1914977 RepID=UPI002BAC6842
LATQAADASSTKADQDAMQSEFDALGSELTNVMANTSFGGTALLKDTTGTLAKGAVNFQIGASTAETMSVDLSASFTTLQGSLTAASKRYDKTGGVGAAGSELNGGTASATIDLLSTAIDSVGTIRSSLGAASNRLDHVYNNLSNISTNTKAATGRIMDVDYASETSNMTSNQMLMQAGTAMLKQSNSMSSMVMSLLQ